MSNDNGGSNPLRTSKGGGPHHTTSVPFLQLRYAYMRAIARAWGEPDYLDLLVKLSLSDENRDNGGVLDQFRDDYNLEFPWNKVDFCIAIDEAGKHPSTRRQPVWLPRGGWYGTDDEFEITVPKTPIPEQVTTCLTRYSEMFPSILGSAIKHDGRRTARQPVPPADFAVMGIVMKNFLALIWDPKTEGKLADHFFRQGPAEQLRIFQNLTGYMFPWRFTLKVNQCAAETPSDNKDETWDEYWKSFPNTRITVYIPHKPDASFADPWEETPDAEDPPTDHGLEAVALAAYNATGDQYPFSCG